MTLDLGDDTITHYRLVGRILAVPPADGPYVRTVTVEPYTPRPVSGRYLFAHLVPVGSPTTITPRNGGDRYVEWFTRGSVRLPWPLPPASVGHLSEGGVKVGKVIQILENVAWVDGVLQIADTPAGDALLGHVGADGSDLPVSIAFRPITAVTHPDGGVERTVVELTEVAIVKRSAYPDARLYARGLMPRAPMAARRT